MKQDSYRIDCLFRFCPNICRRGWKSTKIDTLAPPPTRLNCYRCNIPFLCLNSPFDCSYGQTQWSRYIGIHQKKSQYHSVMAYSKIFRYSPQKSAGSATLFRKGKNSDITLSVMTKFDCTNKPIYIKCALANKRGAKVLSPKSHDHISSAIPVKIIATRSRIVSQMDARLMVFNKFLMMYSR
jgi:hypothetical protein